MPYPKSVRILSLILLLIPKALEAREFSSWEEFDLNHPICERPVGLGVGKESFFEIANNVPGREDYNALIQLFRDKKWPELGEGIQAFWKKFETSPLREAVTFLEVQSLFDRSSGQNDEEERLAERKLRSALLLYPKSDFAPLLSATAGAHWLRTGNYQRSLALYELADANYPQHDLHCTYLMGIAEAHFQLRKWDAASAALDGVLKSCQGFRLRAAAQVRKVDMDWLLGKPVVEKDYEKLLANESPFIERFFQPTLANLGEMKYRASQWKEAKYYFDRYLATERTVAGCQPYAYKRLADLAAKMGEKTASVMGKYLQVYEKFPKTDVGRFSYAHGLLADPALHAGAEAERRIRLVDAELDQVADEDWRSRIYVEKGLTLLDLAHPSALAYLNKLRGKTRFAIDKGKTGSFIRKKIMWLAETGKLAPLESPMLKKTLEQVHADWFQATPDEGWAVGFYGKTATQLTVALCAKGDWKEAISLLDRWRQSPIWPKQGPDKTLRWEISNAFLQALLSGENDSALLVEESRALLETFVTPDYAVVPWLATILLHTQAAQAPGTVPAGLPPRFRPLYQLGLARGRRLSGDLVGAQSALKGLPEDPKDPVLTRERVELAKALKQGRTAFTLLRRELATTEPAGRKKVLKEMAEVIVATKSWSLGAELMQTARENVSDPLELGGYYHLAGRALAESRQCKQAIPVFENAFRMSPAAKETAESRFRMGKCWLSENRPEAARQEWQKVVLLKDSFWSPLAQSEIALLTP